MLIVPIKENESIDKALKKFKKKFEKTGAVKQLRARQAFEKPSVGEDNLFQERHLGSHMFQESFCGRRKARIKRMLTKFDKNGDGKLDDAEKAEAMINKFDKNGDGRLNDAERKAAREFLAKEKASGRGQRRPGPRGGNDNQPAPVPGPKLTPADVKSFPNAPLYDPLTLRTVFLEFDNADWEKELADFYHTDVEVPAKLTVDGKIYKEVGVHFRGASSFFTVGEGRKRSLNLSLDFANDTQRLGGYHTLAMRPPKWTPPALM